ncbi:MAG TPA: putative toxin-antitoxin system toxin component, PIN family [Ginsengibacter sp.]
MRVNRYVLDANIWISYFITTKEQLLTDIVIEHRITFYYCEELIVEIKRVLAYPHLKKYHINIVKAIDFIKQIGVDFTLALPIKYYIPEDENDNYIVALALQTNSGFITSGDKHILDQKSSLEKKYKKLKILTKAEFEKMFKKG